MCYLYASVQVIENSPFPLLQIALLSYFMLKRGGSIFTVLPLTACQILFTIYHFSLLGATVCMRAKKDFAFPVLKYSYQSSSVFA